MSEIKCTIPFIDWNVAPIGVVKACSVIYNDRTEIEISVLMNDYILYCGALVGGYAFGMAMKAVPTAVRTIPAFVKEFFSYVVTKGGKLTTQVASVAGIVPSVDFFREFPTGGSVGMSTTGNVSIAHKGTGMTFNTVEGKIALKWKLGENVTVGLVRDEKNGMSGVCSKMVTSREKCDFLYLPPLMEEIKRCGRSGLKKPDKSFSDIILLDRFCSDLKITNYTPPSIFHNGRFSVSVISDVGRYIYQKPIIWLVSTLEPENFPNCYPNKHKPDIVVLSSQEKFPEPWKKSKVYQKGIKEFCFSNIPSFCRKSGKIENMNWKIKFKVSYVQSGLYNKNGYMRVDFFEEAFKKAFHKTLPNDLPNLVSSFNQKKAGRESDASKKEQEVYLKEENILEGLKYIKSVVGKKRNRTDDVDDDTEPPRGKIKI